MTSTSIILSIFAVAAAAYLIVLFARTAASRSESSAGTREARAGSGPSAAALERFRSSVRIDTHWPEGAAGNGDTGLRAEAEARLEAFQDHIVSAYPALRSACELRRPSPYSFAYRLAGTDPTLPPVLLLSHYDVVPAEAEAWSVDPFSAELKDGFVYGRGTIDTKITLFGIAEAAEKLVAEGFRPRRDLWFAFGGDEERSGTLGAVETARKFREEGIRFAWCLDEGGIVSDRIVKGIDKPLALVGVEEKGFLDIELSVDQEPGHASRPPRVQAVAVLGRALHRLSRKPFPLSLIPSVEAFFRSLSTHMGFGKAFFAANARLLGPVFTQAVAADPEMAAFLRTTLAMTQLEGSPAENVLPSRARAVLNLRLLPPWTVGDAVERVRRVVADPRVKVAASAAREASDPVLSAPGAASDGAPGWEAIKGALEDSCPEAAALPYLVTATTDSRHYAPLCDAVYRFAPVRLDAAELKRVHGHDERLSLDNVALCVSFYEALISRL